MQGGFSTACALVVVKVLGIWPICPTTKLHNFRANNSLILEMMAALTNIKVIAIFGKC